MLTRTSLPRAGLIKIAAVLSLCCSAVALAESTTDDVPGLTTDQLVTELHSSGFEARSVTDSPLPKGAASQVITGTSGARVLITAFGCPAQNQERICALTFLSIFPDAGTISTDAFFALNAVTLSKVLANPGPDGKQSGFRVFYAYPCQGFQDAKFVPMILRAFGDSIATVLAAYRTLGAAKPSVGRAQPTTPDLQTRVSSEQEVQRAGA